jgi:hypothetical protein
MGVTLTISGLVRRATGRRLRQGGAPHTLDEPGGEFDAQAAALYHVRPLPLAGAARLPGLQDGHLGALAGILGA